MTGSGASGHRPLRQCAACRQMKPKEELLRVCRSAEGGVHLDQTGKMPGRGAYICRSEECLKRAERKNLLARSLHCLVPAALYEEMRKALKEEE